MNETSYCVCLLTPIGRRAGTLTLRESGGRVEGFLQMMNRETPFSGRLGEDGRLVISGTLRTLLSTVSYTATGAVCGKTIRLNLQTASGADYSLTGEEAKE